MRIVDSRNQFRADVDMDLPRGLVATKVVKQQFETAKHLSVWVLFILWRWAYQSVDGFGYPCNI